MIRGLSLLFCALLMSACSTISRGTQDYLRIDTVPQGARVITTEAEVTPVKSKEFRGNRRVLKNRTCDATPCAIPVPRRTTLVAKIEMDGYEPAEIYVSNSANTGALAADMAITTTATVGSSAAIAAASVGLANTLALTTNTLIAGTVSLGTFGLVPAETAIAYATANTPQVSSGAAATAAIGPALVISGGMLLIDTGAGANLNLYPNPIVLQLTPEGQASLTDPLAIPYREKITAEVAVSKYCRKVPRAKKESYKPKCIIAREKEKTAKAVFKDLEGQVAAARKASVQAAKIAAREARAAKEN